MGTTSDALKKPLKAVLGSAGDAPLLHAAYDAAKFGLRSLQGEACECPVCNKHTRFLGFVDNAAALGFRCASCNSYPRHRLIALYLRAEPIAPGAHVVHFAPEAAVSKLVRGLPVSYTTADITPGRADRVLDIEALALPDASVDVVICSHVLEHVDDRRALAELYRVLRPGGRALLMVPICEGLDATYEDASITAPDARAKHFGRYDHVRYYGRDFRDRVRAAGFALAEFTADGPMSVRYGLARGEKVFVASKA